MQSNAEDSACILISPLKKFFEAVLIGAVFVGERGFFCGIYEKKCPNGLSTCSLCSF